MTERPTVTENAPRSAEIAAWRTEAFRAAEALDERYYTPEALEGCIKDFARYIVRMADLITEREATNALLRDVAHAAWHVLDEGGESVHDDVEYDVSARDVKRLSDALDALEATGWQAHSDGSGV